MFKQRVEDVLLSEHPELRYAFNDLTCKHWIPGNTEIITTWNLNVCALLVLLEQRTKDSLHNVLRCAIKSASVKDQVL